MNKASLQYGSQADLVWVFGYGSLIFRPDFPYVERQPASILGWARRFWQGSHDHRGMPDCPGRVVTLIPSDAKVCHGMAYLIEQDVFEHLDYREKNGYTRVSMDLRLAEAGPVEGVVYVADEGNFAFLGDAPLDDIAEHIRHSVGPSGANIDYLLELADALRELEIDDPHVFALESRLR